MVTSILCRAYTWLSATAADACLQDNVNLYNLLLIGGQQDSGLELPDLSGCVLMAVHQVSKVNMIVASAQHGHCT